MKSSTKEHDQIFSVTCSGFSESFSQFAINPS
nr:MAG TPA: hypothetical protein [Caudoviricetes sp.]